MSCITQITRRSMIVIRAIFPLDEATHSLLVIDQLGWLSVELGQIRTVTRSILSHQDWIVSYQTA